MQASTALHVVSGLQMWAAIGEVSWVSGYMRKQLLRLQTCKKGV